MKSKLFENELPYKANLSFLSGNSLLTIAAPRNGPKPTSTLNPKDSAYPRIYTPLLLDLLKLPYGFGPDPVADYITCL